MAFRFSIRGSARFVAAAWLAVLAAPAFAATTTTVVDLHTASGVTQRVLDVRPDAPIATVVALPGGSGVLGIDADGSVDTGCFPFYRTRLMLADRGIATVMVDRASDGSVWRQQNVAAVVDWSRERTHGPVWLAGGSSSANPAAAIAAALADVGGDGAVFFSPDPPGPSVAGVRRPSLVIFNARDMLQSGAAFYTELTGTSAKELAVLTGGSPGGCGFHLFQGLEAAFAERIAGFVVDTLGTGSGFDNNQSGLAGAWANPATDSQGFVIDVVADLAGPGRPLLFGGWFTYDATVEGGVRWYTVQGALEATGPSTVSVYRTLGGSLDSLQPATTEEVGTARVAFADCTHATLDYAFDGGPSGSIPMIRLLSNATCSPGAGGGPAGSAGWSGAWADPGNSGQGLVFDFDPVQGVLFAAWYAFAPDAAPDSGVDGQAWYTLQGSVAPGAREVPGITIYESSGGVFDQPAATATVAVGEADLSMEDCLSATLSYRFTAGGNAGRSGTLALARVTPPPAGCTP
jgi:hypothetical protein